MLLFVPGAIPGEVPGKEKREQDDHCPEAPEVIFPGGPLHRLATHRCYLVLRSALPQVGFTGIGKVASGFKK